MNRVFDRMKMHKANKRVNIIAIEQLLICADRKRGAASAKMLDGTMPE